MTLLDGKVRAWDPYGIVCMKDSFTSRFLGPQCFQLIRSLIERDVYKRQQQQQQGNFSLDSYHFAYAFDETHAHLVLLDQTGPRAMQRNVLFILFGVCLLSLLLLFGLSTLFASRTVRPVQEAFERQKNFVEMCIRDRYMEVRPWVWSPVKSSLV